MELLTIQETAGLLKVNAITVRRYIAAGRLPAVRVGRGVRVRKEAVEQFLAPVTPERAGLGLSIPQGKPFTMDDSLWNIVGIGESEGPTDISEHKHQYLAEAYATGGTGETPMTYVFTSESVAEGHPDKVCDYIADSILDTVLAQDARSRVACEVLCKSNIVVLAGEITTRAQVDFAAVARQAVREIGYTDPAEPFCADTLFVEQLLTRQAPEIAQGVQAAADQASEQGAGDQGVMFGFASDETPELMPLPVLLAHRLARGLAEDRKSGTCPWLRPDGKTQVSVRYEGHRPVRVTTVLVSTQHAADRDQEAVRAYVAETLLPRAMGEWHNPQARLLVNPTGSFVHGGPATDSGLTGRKIIVDTYGGMARHGGGSFSGKDPSKVDRSGAYFCRYVARQVVQAGLARKAEIQVSYAIGVAQPLSVKVDTFGTGDEDAAAAFVRQFDFRPAAIIERLDLLRPIYRQTTNYGHFGKPGLPWER
ncbi:MAG: methionine adenosyltransferase [Chloroflexi bacterium]|nr:methionine adenosyltransferase [Chloroflexota bacterium]